MTQLLIAGVAQRCPQLSAASEQANPGITLIVTTQAGKTAAVSSDLADAPRSSPDNERGYNTENPATHASKGIAVHNSIKAGDKRQQPAVTAGQLEPD